MLEGLEAGEAPGPRHGKAERLLFWFLPYLGGADPPQEGGGHCSGNKAVCRLLGERHSANILPLGRTKALHVNWGEAAIAPPKG